MPAEELSVHSSKDAEPGHKDLRRRQECTASRVSEEEQPGPSRVQSRQGYCSFCQVLYSNVEQHIQSPRHREVVRSSRSSVKSGSLMERFLQDVIQHHPHHYNDPRPTHSDLPSLSRPLVPREELSEVCRSDDDAVSMGTREDMPSSENTSSCQLVYVQEAEVTTTTGTNSQQREGKEGKMDPDRLAGFVPGEDIGRTPVQRTHTPLSEHSHTPPPVHRKAHRKTNRRRERGSSSSSVCPPVVTPTPQPSHQPSSKPMDPSPDPKPRVESFTWVEWVAKPPWKRDEAFSSDHSDPIGDLIEEVIEKYCYGRSPVRRQQGDTESFHFSLPESQGTADSEEWDTPVQEALGQDTHIQGGRRTPGPARQPEGRDLTCLTEVQVNLEDEVYTSQLDSALKTLTHGEGREEGGTGEEVGREPRIEDILPALPHIPQSFVGKTWTQVLLEDEVKVETMVQEFRQGHFFCYFDSESLARYGRKGHSKRRQNKQFKEANVFPLLDHDEDDPQCTRRRRRRASRRCSFRIASRCQVVKVSQSTQTVPFVVPFVRQQTLTQSGAATDSQKSCQDPSVALEQEKTPEMRTRLCSLRLPPSYSRVMTPLQPKTSLLYVLCSPETTPTDPKPRLRAGGRGRKRRVSTCEGDGGLKVKYKRVPLRYYDPVTNRIVKSAPKGFLPPPSSAAPRPPHIRQLFRSLSPDINSERLGAEGREPGGRPAAGEGRDGSGSGRRRGRSAGSAVSGSAGVKGQGSSEAGSSLTRPFSRSSLSNSSRFLLGALTPDTASDPDVVSRRSRKSGKRKSVSPPTPEKGPSPPYTPHRPGLRRGGGREKAVSRSSKRGRPPRALTPKELSPSPQPKKGASQRGVERRTVPCSRGPARSVPPTAGRHRPLGCRSSPRLTPVPLSPRTLRTRVGR